MAENVVYDPVDAIALPDDLSRAYYRTCDICQESACEDIWAGKLNERDWRDFFQVRGGDGDGLIVCGNCMDAFLKEN